MRRDLDSENFNPKTKEYELLRKETLSETIERMTDRDRQLKQKNIIHLDLYKSEKKPVSFYRSFLTYKISKRNSCEYNTEIVLGS